MVAMTAIDRTSAGHRRHAAAGGSWSAALAAATLAVGISGRLTVPVALIATLAALRAAQLVLSLRPRSRLSSPNACGDPFRVRHTCDSVRHARQRSGIAQVIT